MKIKQITVLALSTIVLASCGGDKETTTTSSETGTESTEETVVNEPVIEVNTFVNPALSFVDDVLAKNEFTVEEISEYFSYLPLNDLTIAGYASGDVSPVIYSSQGGKIMSKDGTVTIDLATEHSKGEVPIEKEKLVAIHGDVVTRYNVAYDTDDEICNLFVRGAEFVEVNEADIVHLNNIKNIDPSKPMLAEEVKSVVNDYFKSAMGNGKMTVSGVIKNISPMGNLNDDGTHTTSLVTLIGAETSYRQILVTLQWDGTADDFCTKAIKDGSTVSFTGDFDGSGLINGEINK